MAIKKRRRHSSFYRRPVWRLFPGVVEMGRSGLKFVVNVHGGAPHVKYAVDGIRVVRYATVSFFP